MTMVGVLTHAHVSDHREPRNMLFDLANRALHFAVLIPRFTAGRVFTLRNPKQDYRWYPRRMRLARFLHHLIDRQLRHPRHRADRLFHITTSAHEIGLDQIVGT